MKLLVTGANGFLGTAVVRALLAHGETDLRCFVRLGGKADVLQTIAADYPAAKVEIFTGNLGNRDDIGRALAGVDVVYHLAATLRGAPADVFRGCVVNSERLVEAMAATGRNTKVVLVSSFGVYGAQDAPGTPLLTEESPVEPHPERRDVYSHAKVWQEKVFREARSQRGFPLVVVRPGVVYGPRGAPISTRVGVALFGLFVNLGGENILPLTYVENCAEAIVVVGREGRDGEVYNITDDDLPTCNEYLARYRREVKKLRTIRLGYGVAYPLSKLVEWYAGWSKGQLPSIITPYKVRSLWRGTRFSNDKLKRLGWKQTVPTDTALRQTFAALREQAARESPVR
jgi:nucleoside-diphosphate-sugar epimerase